MSRTTMFVYFNDEGSIKCISPVKDDPMSFEFECTEFDIQDVIGFIDGSLRSLNYRIKPKKDKITEYEIVEKKKHGVHVVRLNKFLSQIPFDSGEADLTIEIKKSKIKFSLASHLRSELVGKNTILGLKRMPFIVTAKNNPYVVIQEFYIQAEKLIKNQVVEYNINFVKDSISVYTKKVLESYKVI